MPEAILRAWDDTNKEWIKVEVDTSGRLLTVATYGNLNNLEDVHVPAPTDGYILYWNDGNSRWECKAVAIGAHKDSHDPVDGSDKLDTAEPVKVGDANAIGTSHELARADHVHEKHHAKFTADEAVTAMGAIADDNPLHHNRAAEWGATEHLAIGNNAPHHAKYTDAEAVDAIEADDNLPLASITFIIDGGGEAITTGEKGHLRIPFACTINRVTMLADRTGSIVVDIWKDTYANFPPTDDPDSITHETPPTISNQKSEDSTLAGWTIAIAAGDILAFNVDSCTTIKRVTISLKVTKT